MTCNTYIWPEVKPLNVAEKMVLVPYVSVIVHCGDGAVKGGVVNVICVPVMFTVTEPDTQPDADAVICLF